jgi:hypothetical protein
MIRGTRYNGSDRIVDLWLRARDQEWLSALDNLAGDRGDLCGCLAQTKDDFGKSLPEVAMRIDACEPEILKWRGAHRRKNFRSGTRWIEVAVTDEVEQFLQLGVGHGALI